MILANNIRDIEKDRAYRLTTAILLGRLKAAYLLYILLAAAYVSVIILILVQVIDWLSGVVLLALPLAIRLSWSYRPRAKRHEERNGMKWAAYHHWGFGLLFASGIWLSSLLF